MTTLIKSEYQLTNDTQGAFAEAVLAPCPESADANGRYLHAPVNHLTSGQYWEAEVKRAAQVNGQVSLWFRIRPGGSMAVQSGPFFRKALNTNGLARFAALLATSQTPQFSARLVIVGPLWSSWGPQETPNLYISPHVEPYVWEKVRLMAQTTGAGLRFRAERLVAGTWRLLLDMTDPRLFVSWATGKPGMMAAQDGGVPGNAVDYDRLEVLDAAVDMPPLPALPFVEGFENDATWPAGVSFSDLNSIIGLNAAVAVQTVNASRPGGAGSKALQLSFQNDTQYSEALTVPILKGTGRRVSVWVYFPNLADGVRLEFTRNRRIAGNSDTFYVSVDMYSGGSFNVQTYGHNGAPIGTSVGGSFTLGVWHHFVCDIWDDPNGVRLSLSHAEGLDPLTVVTTAMDSILFGTQLDVLGMTTLAIGKLWSGGGAPVVQLDELTVEEITVGPELVAGFETPGAIVLADTGQPFSFPYNATFQAIGGAAAMTSPGTDPHGAGMFIPGGFAGALDVDVNHGGGVVTIMVRRVPGIAAVPGYEAAVHDEIRLVIDYANPAPFLTAYDYLGAVIFNANLDPWNNGVQAVDKLRIVMAGSVIRIYRLNTPNGGMGWDSNGIWQVDVYDGNTVLNLVTGHGVGVGLAGARTQATIQNMQWWPA